MPAQERALQTSGPAGQSWCILILAVVCGVCPGCSELARPTNDQLQQGLIWLFPGVEGGPFSMVAPVRAFRNDGVQAAFEIHDWKRPLGAVANLVCYEGNRAAAKHVAARIAEYHSEYPNSPIDLVGYSGGGGMAVMVAEALNDDVRLRNVVLCQPALSPDYDLGPTLSKVAGKVVCFCSPFDAFTLGLGTIVFGTMDRRHVASAGKDGFTITPAIAEAQSKGMFEQRSWQPEMILTGHGGAHLGILSAGWNGKYVAPYLRPGKTAD